MYQYEFKTDVKTTIVVDEKLGVTTAVLTDGTDIFSGASRLDPQDNFDPTIGEELAVARALKAWAKALEREAFDIVHDRDEARESQREASAEAAERKRQATYKFQCEFAALINYKLAQDSLDELAENAIAPAFNGRLPHPSTSVKKAQLKVNDLRANLPA